ncbi:MAG: aminotransferase class I/II-fold pyridoxal phosphate-dependent enzyme [Pseudomonadales bacterium]
MSPHSATRQELLALEVTLSAQLSAFKASGIKLDLTRGKPSDAQLDLSNALDGALGGTYHNGTIDLRNYGGLDGIAEAKTLFSPLLGVKPEEVLIGGNSSLSLMYQSVLHALHFGTQGAGSEWRNEGTVKFLCPVPGYDRHFTICEQLGIAMVNVPFTADGPNMDRVEDLVAGDSSIKGIWCVPRFSNPTGHVYRDEIVQQIARLAHKAGPNFRIFWDNAYAVHALTDDAPNVLPIMDACREQGTENSVLIFGSTSKITFASAGLGYMGASQQNLKHFKAALAASTIGPDKINQQRHVLFLRNKATIEQHMRQHAEILAPKFQLVFGQLEKVLGNDGYGSWSHPQGGYFVSFDTLPGLATQVVDMAADAGVKLTAAGATFPYGKDPADSNIRLAPSYPTLDELQQAMQVFTTCVRLATVQQRLAN